MGLVQKSFSDIITFSRSSNATRVGPTGLVEYAPHNLLTYSQQFDNAAWTKGNTTVTANAAAGPDGTVTADKAIISAATAITQLYGSITGVIGQPYTVSVYAKKAELQYVNVGFIYSGGVWAGAQFDLNAGTVVRSDAVGSGASVSSATISSVGNGWYRCSVVVTLGFTNLFPNACPSNTQWTSGRLDQSLTGDGTSGIYLWGAQLAVGPYALDYTPTTSAAVYGPRFDYDPVTLAARGLLVEESRTNLSTYSEDFSNAVWVSYSASKTATFAAAPNGTITANRISENASNTLQAIYNTISTSTTGARTVSVFAKAAERSFFRVSLSGAGATEWFGATFDLQNGTVTQQNAGAAGTVSGATITAFGSGWYRCTVTGDTGSTGVTYAYIGPALTGTPSAGSFGVLTYSGNSSNGVLAWGAQVEQASFATSYIPTLASTVTRSADVASVNTLSPWFNATEGTLFAEASRPALGGAAAFACLSTDANNRIQIGNRTGGGGTARLDYWVSTLGVDQAYLTFDNTFAANTPAKIAGAYKADDFAASANGATTKTDSSGSVPAIVSLLLGANTTTPSSILNGHLRRVAFFPRRLSNAELQALTA